MHSREPVYKDLLDQGITEEHLAQFLGGLFIPVADTYPINNSVFCSCKNDRYDTALSYATAIGDIKMAAALLKIGAHPNTFNEPGINTFALLISLEGDKNRMPIFSLLLTVFDIDIFVETPLGSAFDLGRNNTKTIFSLLKADQQFSICPDEEINTMATTIANARDPNFTVCQSIATIRAKELEIKKIIIEKCTLLQPLNTIVFSYLFGPKPKSLETFQAKHGTPPKPQKSFPRWM